MEAFHGSLNALLSMSHPTIWKLIEGLKKFQLKTNGEMELLLAGQDPPRPRKKYLDVTVRLTNIVTTYQNRTPVEFLRGVAHNIGYNVE